MESLITAKPYTGQIQAVILDLSGTALDHGCFGNVAAFQAAFASFGVNPTIAEIRKPMGLAKREHITEILAMPRIASEWRQQHGNPPDDEATALVFAKLLQVMPETLASYTDPVPGCIETLAVLREKGIKIGCTTAYSRSMMERLLPAAAAKGFHLDCLVASDEVTRGRPWPWMCWHNCEKMDIFPLESVIKIGDTVADVEEGVNAGHWSVGVTQSSGAIGLTPKEAANSANLGELEASLASKLREAGAHFVIHTIAELPAVCDQINSLLASGIGPSSYYSGSSKEQP